MSGFAALNVISLNSHEGWKNVDICPDFGAHEVYDITTGIREPANSVELIWMGDIFEHLFRSKQDFVLKECIRVLEPGGALAVCVPDMTEVMKRWLAADGEAAELHALVWGQQGEQIEGRNALPDSHLHGFTEQSLRKKLEKAGFSGVERVTIHGGACWYELSMRATKGAA